MRGGAYRAALSMTATVPTTAPAPPVAAAGRLRSLLLVVNPSASRAEDAEAAEAERILRRAFAVRAVRTEGRGHAADLARQAAQEGLAVVAVMGGDGTTGDAARGLAGTATALACLPAGCTNAFARAIGMPRRPVPAANRLAALEDRDALHDRAVDLGTINGRPFLGTAGIGISASMTAVVDDVPAVKARLGQLGFAGAAATEVARRYLRRPPRMRVHAGGRSVEGITAVIQNSHVLTYFGPRGITVCDRARLDGGTVSLTLLREAGLRDIPPVLVGLVRGRVADHPHIEGFPDLREATVVSADGAPLPVEADGEYLGEQQRVEFGVAPGALRVVA